MSQYAGETGAWWTDFPGSGIATWSAPAPSSEPGVPAPARDGIRGAFSRRALKRGLVVGPGKRERARREAVAERRRQIIAGIREPSLKSGVITVGSGFGGTGKTDVAVTLAAIYAAARPADRVILADSNDDMPHGYIRLGGAPVEALPLHQRTLSIRGFYQACLEGRIRIYADLRDAVAWLQGVAVIRGDTADECVGMDFGEKEYLTVLEFLQCMSNIVVNDGGTGLFAKLQVGTLLHGDKYVFVTEASQLGFWSIDQVFSRYRNYEGEQERPLTEQERKHLIGLMDEATVVVDKFVESDPEQVKWHARICESFEGTRVSVAATAWDQALANRVPLDLSAVAPSTLDAKLAMAEVVLRGADRANRRRQGLPEEEMVVDTGARRDAAELQGWSAELLPPAAGPGAPAVDPDGAAVDPDGAAVDPDGAAVDPDGAAVDPDGAAVRILPRRSTTDSPAAGPDIPSALPGSGAAFPDGGAAFPDSPAAGEDIPSALPDGGAAFPDSPAAGEGIPSAFPDSPAAEEGLPSAHPDSPAAGTDIEPAYPDSPAAGADIPSAFSDRGAAFPDGTDDWPEDSDVRIIPARSDRPDPGPGTSG